MVRMMVLYSFIFVGLFGCSSGAANKSTSKKKKVKSSVAPPPVAQKGCFLAGSYAAETHKGFEHTNHMFLNSDHYVGQPLSLAEIIFGEKDSEYADSGTTRGVSFVPQCHAYSQAGKACNRDPQVYIDPWLEKSFFLSTYNVSDYDSAILPAGYNGKAVVDEIFEINGETYRLFALFSKIGKRCDSIGRMLVALQPCGDCSDIAMSGRIELLRHFKPDPAKKAVAFRR